MTDKWNDAVISKSMLAAKASARFGRTVHTDRPFHGFVLNDPGCETVYCFSDGKVLHTRENELFYLPKGSSYQVTSNPEDSAYVINFESDLLCEPFTMPLSDVMSVRKLFFDAAKEWELNEENSQALVMKKLYGIILLTVYEVAKNNLRDVKSLIRGIQDMANRFTESSLAIEELAALSDMTLSDFRRYFRKLFGLFPKEYLIRLRIKYAKSLLNLGSFSVSEVAALTGYSDLAHFSREFSKRTGISPSAYTKTNRKGNIKPF